MRDVTTAAAWAQMAAVLPPGWETMPSHLTEPDRWGVLASHPEDGRLDCAGFGRTLAAALEDLAWRLRQLSREW